MEGARRRRRAARPAALLIGLGGGTQVHLLHRLAAPRHITVIERDPVIVRVASEWFGLDRVGGLEIVCADAEPQSPGAGPAREWEGGGGEGGGGGDGGAGALRGGAAGGAAGGPRVVTRHGRGGPRPRARPVRLCSRGARRPRGGGAGEPPPPPPPRPPGSGAKGLEAEPVRFWLGARPAAGSAS